MKSLVIVFLSVFTLCVNATPSAFDGALYTAVAGIYDIFMEDDIMTAVAADPEDDIFSIEVFNASGDLVAAEYGCEGTICSLSMSAPPSGTYTVIVKAAFGKHIERIDY